ncbi:MAG: glycosyltransferase [Gemmatimonadota bacterium]|nr:glycosyltransferase [Gemmatimonadota bacterium]
MTEGLVMVLSGFPRRSETFALNEIAALAARGMLTAVFATKPGDGLSPHPVAAILAPMIEQLPTGTPSEQGAALVARLRGRRVTGVHAYFAHTPTDVAQAASCRLGVRYGFSTHAKDARKVAPEALRQRGLGAACVVACNTDVARTLRTEGVATHLIPHGVDLSHFRPTPVPPGPPTRLLAVGRLVAKKGFDVLLEALTALQGPWELTLVGDGPERARLEGLATERGIARQVHFAGSCTHAALPRLYAEAQVVVVPSVEDATGDRDGLPNVVLEAMASGRAVVASDIGATASAILSGRTGLLVPPREAPALTRALERLVRQPALGVDFGRHARRRVEEHFDLGRCTRRLERVLETAYA